jgi:phosphonate transport system substrate-binding protein
MVRDDLPAAIRDRVRQVLLELGADPAGRTILAGLETTRFQPADDASYEPVRAFIARFEREVRPVEEK